ncbi:hydantoinase [Variovorax paradoxus]|uniref:hydantoinase/oxoprolinase family protein n=1 Tax=Variovorax paradoxus TaxID=34073 RepID=UPI0006E5DAFC|nr:hydantoinase [Variovorax paradoxus]KPV02424.1 hydantoinase [Variovorax paradoxus]KPV03719.1 hydantoinase [Variovorax paradoxus]KPV18625.1 hydantoinase [Variovorax paradoxus]KPV29102.1 hydantoinase [Variovorax paradoxus]
MTLRIGVDIGGSFADFAVLDSETRTVRTLKVFSRPDSPGSEVLQGMDLLEKRYGIRPQDVSYFTHGTTVGVNAVVQRKGLRLALITTRNFEDVLEVARLKIPDMYHLMSARPDPLIPRDRVFGVDERLNYDGTVDTPVDEASVLRAMHEVERADCDGVVISLLHSYRNPAHELRVKEIVGKAWPDLFVSCSHEVWPIIREYERTLTAVIGGYVQPKVSNYLSKLQGALAEAGVTAELKVTKSNGGVMAAEDGKQNCVQMILSGTASGVIGAAYIARECELKNCMSLDIGGTTADVALIIDGRPQYATGEFIGDFQIHIPSVSVSSIGDGGGSIARVDEFGVLKVGPDSAGSNPGPVCYGRGGLRPTITDAFAVMGVLGQYDIGYNAVTVDREAALRAIDVLAKEIGQDAHRTAEAIVNVSISGMYAGVSRLVSRFGIDPREFALMPFGGAGPMLACHVARALNIEKIVVPTTPGVLSALGGLIADTKNDFVRTTYFDLDEGSLERLRQGRDDLEVQARDWMRRQLGTDTTATIELSADMRYRGQSFEIATPLPGVRFTASDLGTIRSAFNAAHEALYGHSDDSAAIQVISIRLVITAPTPKPSLQHLEVSQAKPKPMKEISVYLDGQTRTVPMYQRSDLRATQHFEGPAVVAQDDTTTCVLPGYSVNVDTFGNLVITPSRAGTDASADVANESRSK